MGEAGLQVLEAGPDVELGYTLARAAWGRGYATEAARAVLRWGFAGLRLPRVVAVADPANAASLHVLDKLGHDAARPAPLLRRAAWSSTRSRSASGATPRGPRRRAAEGGPRPAARPSILAG